MFTVYNKGSVTFQSTSGNLYNIDTVDKSAESRLKPDDDRIDSFDSMTGGKKFPRQAVDAYKKMANSHTSDEVFHVKDIMVKDFVSIHQDATLQEAYDLLKKYKISQVPIVTEDKEIVSMVNKKHILNLLMNDLDYVKDTLNRKLFLLDLPEILATSPVTDIRRVAQVLVESHHDALPVVDNNHILVGIVSKTNIIKAVSDIPNIQFFA